VLPARSIPHFRRALLRWYAAHRRDLPWRRRRDAYGIWISEIMLQQTRVAVVMDYYERFLAGFPDLRSLAKARSSDVLAVWSGLGYYRRARNLHRAARLLARNGGEMPTSQAELGKLPGIGRYTSAAIASIAFGEACAAVDGNIERVLHRLAGKRLSASDTWHAAQRLLCCAHPGDFNQAMMELGATLCLPGEPLCGDCPVARWCAGCHRSGSNTRATVRLPRKKKTVTHLLNRREDRVLLSRRAQNAGLMPGMWELPRWDGKGDAGEMLLRVKHSITNTDYDVRVVSSEARPAGSRWFPIASVTKLPLTGLTRKILRQSAPMR
jgi:A/G-specific adenine glycosylase